MLTLYLCSRPADAHLGYDEMHSCVVAAESPEIALQFADAYAGDERGSFEEDSTYWQSWCKATPIGNAFDIEPGMICRNFKAG